MTKKQLVFISIISTLYVSVILSTIYVLSIKNPIETSDKNINYLYTMGQDSSMGGNGKGNNGGNNNNNNNNNNNGGNGNAGGGNANAQVNAGGNNAKAKANKNKTKTTITVKSISKQKGKKVYTPKYSQSVRIVLFESDWITFDATSLAYSNDSNSRNRFGEVTTMVTFNLHKLWERRSKNKEMKENLTYAEEHYKFIQQEDSSWLIKEK